MDLLPVFVYSTLFDCWASPGKAEFVYEKIGKLLIDGNIIYRICCQDYIYDHRHGLVKASTCMGQRAWNESRYNNGVGKQTWNQIKTTEMKIERSD